VTVVQLIDTSLIMKAYKVQTANLTLYKQCKITNVDDACPE